MKKLQKPRPADFGYVSNNTFDGGGTSGWTMEGGEEQYEIALHFYEAAVALQAIKRIKIIWVNAHGLSFENLKSDTEHEVIETPKGFQPDHKGVWVMGVGEPVKVLVGEFEIIQLDAIDVI